MPGFDSLLESEDEKKKKGFDSLLIEPIQSKGFDSLLPETPGTSEYQQKVQQGIAMYKDLGFPGRPKKNLDLSDLVTENTMDYSEEPAEAHPFEDPVRLALMLATPLSLGGGYLATAGTGAAINTGYTIADRYVEKGELPSAGELGVSAAVGAALPTVAKAGGELASHYILKGKPFGELIGDVANRLGVSKSQVNKEIKGMMDTGKYATRGEALDDMAKAYFHVPETPPHMQITKQIDTIDDLVQSIKNRDGIPNQNELHELYRYFNKHIDESFDGIATGQIDNKSGQKILKDAIGDYIVTYDSEGSGLKNYLSYHFDKTIKSPKFPLTKWIKEDLLGTPQQIIKEEVTQSVPNFTISGEARVHNTTTPITDTIADQLMKPIGKGGYPGIPDLEGRVTQETASELLTGTTVPRFDQYGNRITGKTLNLDKLSPDDKVLQQQIDNMVNMFPDESTLPTYMAVDDFRRMASELPGSAADDFFRAGGDSRFPQKELRRLALKNRAAESLFVGHTQEVTSKLAQKVAAGDTTALESFKAALETDLKLAQSTGAFRSELGRELRMLKDPVEAMNPGTKFVQDTTRLLQRLGKDQKFTDEIATQMAKVDVLDPRQRLNFFRSLIQPSNWDRVAEVWYNSILSGVKTQARNTLGNIGAMIYREGEKPIVGGLDFARSAITGQPREAFVRESVAGWTGQTGRQFLRDPLHGVYSILGGFADAAKAGHKAFVTELPQKYDVSINELIGSGKFKGGVIKGTKGRIIRIPSRFMMAMDEAFKSLHDRIGINSLAYRQARIQQAAQNLTDDQFNALFMALKSQPDDVLQKMVQDETLYRVFQNDPGRIVNAFLHFKNSHPLLNAIFPFVRTPVNIGIFTAERLPGPSLAFVINSAKKGSALAVEESIAKMITGGITAIGVYELYKNGLLRGVSVDPRKTGQVKGLQTAGQQNYSFVSPDGQTSVSFLNFTPLSGLLGYMADGFSAMDKHPIMSDDFFGQMTASIFNQIGVQSYMGTWDTIFNDIGQGNLGKGAANATAQVTSGLIPFSSFLRSVGMGNDPTLRTPFENQTFIDKYLDYMKLNIPGLRADVLPVMDIWGNDVVTGDGVAARLLESVGIDPGPGATMVDGIGNPFRIEEASKDPVNIELARLIHSLPPDGQFRGLDSPRLKGGELEGLNLTQEEYVAFVKQAGSMSHDAIAAMIQRPQYQMMADWQKVDFYEKMIEKARKQAKIDLFKNRLIEQKRTKILQKRDEVLKAREQYYNGNQ